MFFNKLISSQKELNFKYRKANKHIDAFLRDFEDKNTILKSEISEIRMNTKIKKKEIDFFKKKEKERKEQMEFMREIEEMAQKMKQEASDLLVEETNNEIASEFRVVQLKKNAFNALRLMTSPKAQKVDKICSSVEKMILRRLFRDLKRADQKSAETEKKKKKLISEILTQNKLICLIEGQTSTLKNQLRQLQSDFENKFNGNF